MNCTSCTSPVPTGARFCPACGTRLVSPSAAPFSRVAAPADPFVAGATPVAPADPFGEGATSVAAGAEPFAGGGTSADPFARGGAPAALTGVGHERKLVTAVFCDLVGSTELSERLDPETLRAVTLRYFAAMREPIERYGGTVEKFIGDAVMAVFGVPVMHEDDAARAVAAAYGMRAALDVLNTSLERELGIRLGIRIGVHTGSAVTGTDVSQRQALVSGQTVNVAARLQGRAAPGEILLGERTRREAGPVARVEPAGPQSLKGVSEPVVAYRLHGLGDDAPELRRRFDVPFVGRAAELADLDAALDGVTAAGAARVVTVVGEAGIGKTRLLREWLARPARPVLHGTGRCRPYGERGSLTPLAEAVRPLGTAGLPPEEAAVLEGGLLRDGTPGPSPDATRAALAHLLAHHPQRPVVLVLDDFQWASEPLLELTHRLGTGAGPVLIVCLARHDLLDRRPEPDGASWHLTGLSPADCATLAASLTGGDARHAEQAGGNPLYLEQLCASGADQGPRGTLPQTLEALLGARVDALPERERRTLEAAAVWGAEFRAGDPAVLAGLVRRRMIEPAGPGAHRFCNGLIRSAVYQAMAKATRARRHEQAADTLTAEHGPPAAVGTHLERAYRLRRELGDADDTLRRRAAAQLGEGGAAALARSDLSWADNLLGRAERLLTPDDPGWAPIARRLGEVRLARGAGADGRRLLTAVRDHPSAGGGTGVPGGGIDAAHARLRLAVADGAPAAEIAALADRLLPLFRAAGDELGQARARIRAAQARQLHGRHAEALALLDRGLAHALRAGAEPELALALGAAGISLWRGPTPVPAAVDRCRWLLREHGVSRPAVRLTLTCSLAVLLALGGTPVHARLQLAEARTLAADLGYAEAAVVLPRFAAVVEAAAGQPDAALRQVDAAAAAGDTAGAACEAARLLLDRGDTASAVRRLPELSGLPRAEQADLDGLRARLAAHAGDAPAALELAARAVAAAEQTDSPLLRATAADDQAEVLTRLGHTARAATARRRARALYAAKGVVR